MYVKNFRLKKILRRRYPPVHCRHMDGAPFVKKCRSTVSTCSRPRTHVWASKRGRRQHGSVCESFRPPNTWRSQNQKKKTSQGLWRQLQADPLIALGFPTGIAAFSFLFRDTKIASIVVVGILYISRCTPFRRLESTKTATATVPLITGVLAILKDLF